MSARSCSSVLTAMLLLGFAMSPSGQSQRILVTDDGETRDVPAPHSLAWWTHDPLRLDESGDLLIGTKADGVHTLTARDYQVQQKVTTLGTIAGHRIVQVLTTIHAGPHVVIYGRPASDDPPAQWKNLLVEVGLNRYVEVYGLQIDWNRSQIGSAGIYGAEPNSILGTYDPGDGNGVAAVRVIGGSMRQERTQ